jgi:hypothetical protein
MKNIQAFLLLASTCYTLHVDAQIRLVNPSFEGEAQDAVVPNGWDACGAQTTPDVLPGFWGVYTRPQEGNTYMGLITREDGTWEMVGQKLNGTLQKKECYHMSMALSMSPSYSGYNNPIRIRVWGGRGTCEKLELLATSPTIDHKDWRSYDFYCFPENNITYIIIEAYYKEGIGMPYRGNILVDNISAINRCARVELSPACLPDTY